MKQLVLLLLSVLLYASVAFAQTGDMKRSRYSIEFSSGMPSIFTIVNRNQFEKNIYGVYNYVEGKEICDNFHMQSFNAAFRWEGPDTKSDFIIVANISTVTNDAFQYREWVVDGHYPEGGFWRGGPDKAKGQVRIGDASLTAMWRYKWGMMEWGHFYSAVGVGVDLYYPVPIPYLAPFGLSIGEKRRIYGFVEMNISGSATFGLAGLGIRLN